MEVDEAPLETERRSSAVGGTPPSNVPPLYSTAEFDLKANELRDEVQRELQRCNDGTQAMQGVLSLLCERLITVERQLAMFQRQTLSPQTSSAGSNAGIITVQPGTGRSFKGVQPRPLMPHKSGSGNGSNGAWSEEEIAALTTTQAGLQTQVAWEFPSAAPSEVVNLYDRLSQFEQETAQRLDSVDQRLQLMQRHSQDTHRQLQTLAHNIEGTAPPAPQDAQKAAEGWARLAKLESAIALKEASGSEAAGASGQNLQRRQSLAGSARHLDPVSRAEALRNNTPVHRRQMAKRRWREACADIRGLLRSTRLWATHRPILKRKLSGEQTMMARLSGLEARIAHALRLAEDAVQIDQLPQVVKVVLDKEGMDRASLTAEMDRRDVASHDRMQELCRALAGALAAHQDKAATDVMRLSLMGHGPSHHEENDEDEEARLQVQSLLQNAAQGLAAAMQVNGEQSPAYGPLDRLRTRLLQMEPILLTNLCTPKIGSFTALAPSARLVEEALAEVCAHESAAASCLQALPFATLQPAAAEGAVGDAEWQPMTLLDGLRLLHHHLALLLQGGKLQQVELLSLANSQGTWADQAEVAKLGDSLHAMRSQMVNDLDSLYNAVQRLETALAETKAFQELLKSEVQCTMNERQSLEEAVSKLSGRSEMLRAFLDGKIAEVERLVQSKAGANEVFNVKTSINDVMTHLLKVREGLPPEGFWCDVNEQLKSKADKKVLLKLLKSREMKAGVEEANEGSLPAVGRIKLRCLSCDKAIPPDPQERPYMGSPRHDSFTQPLMPNQYDYEEHRYTYQTETVDIVARRERPRSASTYDRAPRMTSYPRAMLGGPLGTAQPLWRMEGGQPGTADEAKGLKRQLFNQRLRELAVVDPPPTPSGAASQEGGDTLARDTQFAHAEMALPPSESSMEGKTYSPHHAAAQAARGATVHSEYVAADQAHSIQWALSDAHMARPRSAPGHGQARHGPLPYDHTPQQAKGWRRPLSKIHVPQRGFPLKSVYYQQGPF